MCVSVVHLKEHTLHYFTVPAQNCPISFVKSKSGWIMDGCLHVDARPEINVCF